MGVLKKIPVIQSVCSLLNSDELTRLLALINGKVSATEYSFISGYDKLLPGSAPATVNERIDHVFMRIGINTIINGIMIYKNTSNCVLIGYTNTVANSTDLPFYKLNFTTRIAEPISEKLSIEELRRTINDCISASASIDPIGLAAKMEGNTGVIVDLNETSTKVEVHLDMTGAGAGKHLACKSTGQPWWTSQGLVPDGSGHQGQYLKHITSGEVWADASAVEIILANLTLSESSGVYTSSETIVGYNDIHVIAECEMSGTHACFGVDLHKYDASVSYGVARVNWGGTMYDVLCRIDEENHVVLDLANLTGLTSVVAKYYKYN